MALSLASIQRNIIGPPRIVLYGVPGIGKTTFAASMPSPIFLPVENGLGALDVPAFPTPETLEDVLEAIRVLLNEEHAYETFVLDSLDRLEPMVWDHVCRTVPTEKGASVSRIEDYGFGKGYGHAKTVWLDLLAGLDALRAKGMLVCLIAHSHIVRIEPPETDAYDRYQMRLHKLAEAAFCDWADAVLFASYKTVTIASGDRKRGISDGTRILHTTERAAWRAKNRYRLPDEMPLDWAAISNAIAAASKPIASTATA